MSDTIKDDARDMVAAATREAHKQLAEEMLANPADVAVAMMGSAIQLMLVHLGRAGTSQHLRRAARLVDKGAFDDKLPKSN